MTTIGQNFPMTRIARKEKLLQIKQGSSISTEKVPGKGVKAVYKIPLQYLSYNPYNTRFLAQSKTLERRFGEELSDENSNHIHEIEKVIWEEKKDRNKSTIDSLIKDGQLHPGVVTADGIILAGNRRFRLLNEIIRNSDKYHNPTNNIVGLEYFEAVILDEEELNKKEIVKYESFYQFGIEEKVEYDPIQKYIAAKDQKELGFTEKEIAENFITLTKGSEKAVKKWLDVFGQMSEYLVYIGEEGIFTALEGREEAFLQLETVLKYFNGKRAGSISWPYTQFDLDDLKLVFFDYIRLNIPTHDFRIFKEIFSDEKQWKRFVKNENDVIESEENHLKSFDEYREDNPEEDELIISKKRQNDYVQRVSKSLKRIFGVENAQVQSKRAQEKPLDILNSIQQKLSKLEEDMSNNPSKNSFEADEFLEAVKDIQKRIGRIKQQVD